MRQSLLQREALFVKLVARSPQLERDLPAGELTVRKDAHHALHALAVMSRQHLDASCSVGEGPAMRRQDETRRVGGESLQSFEVLVQRVRRALRMETDVRRKLGQHVVAGEEKP